MHDVERCLLLRDEEHLPSKRQVVRDEVRDRLRLAGSWRAVQDERLAHGGVQDSRKLRGVGAKRTEEVSVLNLGLDLFRRENLDTVVVVSAALHQVRHERMRRQLVCTLGKVLPHDELAEREMPERGIRLHVPAFHRADGFAERLEHLVNGDS